MSKHTKAVRDNDFIMLPVMEIMAETNETIRDAFNYLQVISTDEQKRLEYESRQLWLMDQRTRGKVARVTGLTEEEVENIR